MSAKIFVVVSIWKEARLSSSLFKLIRQQNTFIWHLVFNIWLLVNDLSNEKNILTLSNLCCINFLFHMFCYFRKVTLEKRIQLNFNFNFKKKRKKSFNFFYFTRMLLVCFPGWISLLFWRVYAQSHRFLSSHVRLGQRASALRGSQLSEARWIRIFLHIHLVFRVSSKLSILRVL